MSRPSPLSPKLKTSGAIRIHPIKTGTLQMRPAQIRAHGTGIRRYWRILMDREWTRELPIYCYLIEHPEGLFMVDTGESARAMKPDFFPAWNLFHRRAIRYRVEPDDEVGPQLGRLGFSPGDVSCVIMTHMHAGHSGGLSYFKRARIVMSGQEWAACTGGVGRLAGYSNAKWPEWLAPRIVTFNAGTLGGLARSQPLTGDGAIFLVRTPGHTLGHISAVVQDGDLLYFFAGDASYLHATMCEAAPDGFAVHPRLQISTLTAIRNLALDRPMIYLPTHDPDAERRLRELDVSLD
jgi:N-acyl homoserine lactone hydrolase